MKTYSDWSGSGVDLGKFLTTGDSVDQELYDYCIGCVPPVYWRRHVMCMGEATCSDPAGTPMYMTFRGRVYFGVLTVAEASRL